MNQTWTTRKNKLHRTGIKKRHQNNHKKSFYMINYGVLMQKCALNIDHILLDFSYGYFNFIS